MVAIEQRAVQGYIEKYKLEFINEHGSLGLREWKAMGDEMDRFFNASLFHGVLPPSAEWAMEMFHKRYPDVTWTFQNEDHRVRLGIAIVFFRRNEAATIGVVSQSSAAAKVQAVGKMLFRRNEAETQ